MKRIMICTAITVNVFDLKKLSRRTWLAQSVESEIHDLRVVGLWPTLGVEIT